MCGSTRKSKTMDWVVFKGQVSSKLNDDLLHEITILPYAD